MNYPLDLCPICHSDKIFAFEDIYQNVLTNNFSELSLRKIRFTGERNKKKFRQLILEKTSPPEKPSIGSFDLFISVFGGIIGMMFGMSCNELLKMFYGNNFQPLIFIFTFSGYLKALHLSFKFRVRKKRLVWESKMKKWKESWICLDCGDTWWKKILQ